MLHRARQGLMQERRALICRLRDGRIARLDEYLDSAHVTRFRSGA